MVDRQASPTDCELAWLAGIIEGEGSLAMSIHRHNGPDRKPKVGLKVLIYNSDAGIVKQAVSIFTRMEVGYHLRERELPPMLKPGGEGHYAPTAPMLIIVVSKLTEVDCILRSIRPWLYGEKAARADLMLQFLKRRFEKFASRMGKRAAYDAGDIRLVLEFAKKGRRQGTELIETVLNELEQNTIKIDGEDVLWPHG